LFIGAILVAEVFEADGSHASVVVIRDSQNTYYAVNTAAAAVLQTAANKLRICDPVIK
jgi:hypothetical protein